MGKKVIDFGALEKYIKEIEAIFQKNDLNIVEQDLILKQTHQRLLKKIEKQKAKDMLHDMPMGSLIKKFMKKGMGGSDEE